MLRLKRVVLLLLALGLSGLVGFLAWWFWPPEGRWRERHGDLAAVTRVVLNEKGSEATGASPIVEELRGISTSGLEVAFRYQWSPDLSERRSSTPVALHVRFSDDTWPRWESARPGEVWVSVQSPLDQSGREALDLRSDAFDGAPTVALVLDSLERRLRELGAPPLGRVVVVGLWTEEALAAHAAAYDSRVTDAILVESPGDEAVLGWLVRRSGSLTVRRALRRFQERGGSVTRFQGGAFMEMEAKAARLLADSTVPTELASPQAGD